MVNHAPGGHTSKTLLEAARLHLQQSMPSAMTPASRTWLPEMQKWPLTCRRIEQVNRSAGSRSGSRFLATAVVESELIPPLRRDYARSPAAGRESGQGASGRSLGAMNREKLFVVAAETW